MRRCAQCDFVPRHEMPGRCVGRIGPRDEPELQRDRGVRRRRVDCGKHCVSDRNDDSTVGCHVEHEFGLVAHFAADHERHRAAQVVEVRVRAAVVHAERPLAACRHRDGPVHPRQLTHRRVRHEVGCVDAVGDEIAVVGRVTKLSAVGIAPLGFGRIRARVDLLVQAVVFPLPHESAGEERLALDGRPVVGKRTVRVAHRVAVLAHHERPRRAAARVVDDRLNLRIHRAHHVGGVHSAVDPRRGVAVAAVEDRTLVVQRARRVHRAHQRGERIVVGAEARLIAERPEDHARVVAVAYHHARAPRHPCREVPLVVAQRRVVRVRFNVGLGDDVQPVLVAQVEERGIVRVVAGAHRVAVVALHRDDVVDHVLARHGLAAQRVVIVAVHAADGDAAVVDAHFAVFDADAPEPGDERGVLAGRAEQFDDEAVPVRVFRRPGAGVRQAERRSGAVPREHIALQVVVRNLAHHGLRNALA